MVPTVLELMGVRVLRMSDPAEVAEVLSAGRDAVFRAGERVAVLLGQ